MIESLLTHFKDNGKTISKTLISKEKITQYVIDDITMKETNNKQIIILSSPNMVVYFDRLSEKYSYMTGSSNDFVSICENLINHE